MRCPKCHFNKSSVIDSRQAEEGATIRRRRECENCHYRFTTFERVELLPLRVGQKVGAREQVSRESIIYELDEITYVRFASVYKSFKDVDEIEDLLQQITKRVRGKKKKAEVKDDAD